MTATLLQFGSHADDLAITLTKGQTVACFFLVSEDGIVAALASCLIMCGMVERRSFARLARCSAAQATAEVNL